MVINYVFGAALLVGRRAPSMPTRILSYRKIPVVTGLVIALVVFACARASGQTEVAVSALKVVQGSSDATTLRYSSVQRSSHQFGVVVRYAQGQASIGNAYQLLLFDARNRMVHAGIGIIRQYDLKHSRIDLPALRRLLAANRLVLLTNASAVDAFDERITVSIAFALWDDAVRRTAAIGVDELLRAVVRQLRHIYIDLPEAAFDLELLQQLSRRMIPAASTRFPDPSALESASRLYASRSGGRDLKSDLSILEPLFEIAQSWGKGRAPIPGKVDVDDKLRLNQAATTLFKLLEPRRRSFGGFMHGSLVHCLAFLLSLREIGGGFSSFEIESLDPANYFNADIRELGDVTRTGSVWGVPPELELPPSSDQLLSRFVPSVGLVNPVR